MGIHSRGDVPFVSLPAQVTDLVAYRLDAGDSIIRRSCRSGTNKFVHRRHFTEEIHQTQTRSTPFTRVRSLSAHHLLLCCYERSVTYSLFNVMNAVAPAPVAIDRENHVNDQVPVTTGQQARASVPYSADRFPIVHVAESAAPPTAAAVAPDKPRGTPVDDACCLLDLLCCLCDVGGSGGSPGR